MLRKAKEITPRLLDKLFDAVLFKEEMQNYVSSGGIDHGSLSGLAPDDDHTQYLLASQATDRATFTTNWADLTDGGGTVLHSHALSDITNPTGDKTFAMTTRQLTFLWTNPAGNPLTLEASGAYTGALLHIHQHTGNPGSTYLLELESEDSDVEHISSTMPSAGLHAVCLYVNGDSDERFVAHSDGELAWGPGNAAQDTNLYRSAADTLKTDDDLVVGGGDITLNATTLSEANLIDLTDGGDTTLHGHDVTGLTNWPTIDYSYVSGNDAGTDISAAELEELSDGSTTTLHDHDVTGLTNWGGPYLPLSAGTSYPITGDLYLNKSICVGTSPVSSEAVAEFLMGDSQYATYITRNKASAAGPNLYMRKARGNQASAATAVSGDACFNLNGQVWDGAVWRDCATLQFVAQTVSGANTSGKMNFKIRDASGTAQIRMIIDEDGVATIAQTLVVGGDTIELSTSKTPASAGDTGTTGQIAWDSSYIYICVATDTWKRAAISTW